MPRRVVLISDLQQGSRLEALGDFEWPSDVELDLKTVADDGSNAGLQRLADPAEADRGRARRTTAPRAGLERRGVDGESVRAGLGRRAGTAPTEPIDVYVPPGESRVVRVPRPAGHRADAVAAAQGRRRRRSTTRSTSRTSAEGGGTVLYVGDDRADDPAGLLYYLERVFADTPRRSVEGRVAQPPAARLAIEPGRSVPLVVAGRRDHEPRTSRPLREYRARRRDRARRGHGRGPAPTLAALAGVPSLDVEEATVRRDVMLGEIAFDHPLFAPLAGAQFNDFTKIHFWKYRRIPTDALGDARVLARFESGDAAVDRESRWARGGSSSWRAAGTRPTASSRGRRSSSR